VPILLEPLIASFCQAYPEVEVEIAASEELVDLCKTTITMAGRRQLGWPVWRVASEAL
jgi:DNA-binding transcriptional LysR family regulator